MQTPNEFISQMSANIKILKFKYSISTVPISTQNKQAQSNLYNRISRHNLISINMLGNQRGTIYKIMKRGYRYTSLCECTVEVPFFNILINTVNMRPGQTHLIGALTLPLRCKNSIEILKCRH